MLNIQKLIRIRPAKTENYIIQTENIYESSTTTEPVDLVKKGSEFWKKINTGENKFVNPEEQELMQGMSLLNTNNNIATQAGMGMSGMGSTSNTMEVGP